MKKGKKTKSIKKLLITLAIISIILVISFYMYITYQNIEIDDNNYTASRTISTQEEQTEEKAQENSKNVADIIEQTTRKVVEYQN